MTPAADSSPTIRGTRTHVDRSRNHDASPVAVRHQELEVRLAHGAVACPWCGMETAPVAACELCGSPIVGADVPRLAEQGRAVRRARLEKEARRLAEKARLAEQARIAESDRLAEEARLRAEETIRLAEEKKRLAEEAANQTAAARSRA